MLAWAIRRREWWLRCPLVWLCFPLVFVPVLARRVVLGGVNFDFCNFYWELFWYMHEGGFVRKGDK
jgi:hypothetical protein